MARENQEVVRHGCPRTRILSVVMRLLFWILSSAPFMVPTRADEPAEPRLHRVTFSDAKSITMTLESRVLLTAQNGGLLLEGRDGRLWTVEPQQIQKNEPTDERFQPLAAEELGQQLQLELVDFGVKTPSHVVVTKHFVICSTAGRKYAEWVGILFERLFDGFQQYWKVAGLTLREPEFPLPAIVLKDQTEFADLATKLDGPDAAVSKGYFSIPTNRIVMFDLTASPNSPPAKTIEDIRRKVVASPFNVATVIHEATHQIAFNSGLHTRFADNPLWLTEGMAMFFEVPDLDSHSGWKSAGRVNTVRLKRYRETLKQRGDNASVSTLIRTDDRLQNVEQAETAYAESWALTYFLIKTRRENYVSYLKTLQNKPRLKADSPEERLRDFRQAFGDDLETLDRDLARWLSRLSK